MRKTLSLLPLVSAFGLVIAACGDDDDDDDSSTPETADVRLAATCVGIGFVAFLVLGFAGSLPTPVEWVLVIVVLAAATVALQALSTWAWIRVRRSWGRAPDDESVAKNGSRARQ